MNIEQRRLAIEGVETLDAYLGDHYRNLSSDLNSSLAGTAMETSPAEAVANKAMLDSVVALLPTIGLNYGLSVNEPHEVRLLQANLVWQHTIRDGASITRPFYLLGAQKTGRQMDLLLHAPSFNDEVSDENKKYLDPSQMVIAKGIPRRHYQDALTVMDKLPRTPLEETEMSQVFKNGAYHVQPNNVRSVIVSYEGARERRTQKSLGHTVMRASGFHEITAISDRSLARFNVLDRVAHLAVAFGKKDEVQAVLGDSNT